MPSMYRSFKDVIKARHFLVFLGLGLVLRIGFLSGFYYLFDKDMNDMNEKVWIALSQYAAKGINPYGQSYSMNVMDLSGDNANREDFFQYPPFTLVAFAPTLLWPFPQSYGPTNFMPAFCIISVLASLYVFYRLFKEGYRHSAFVFWVLLAPLVTIFDFTTFTSVPLLLLVLAFVNKEKPVTSGLFMGLGIASYTYLAIPALFLFVFNAKGGFENLKKFVMGLTPAIALVAFFFVLSPSAFIHDIFVSQATNKPANFLYPNYSVPGGPNYWWMHVYSLPPYINTLYNSIVDPTQKLSVPNLTLVLTIVALCVTAFFLVRLARDTDGRKFVFYSFVSLLVLTGFSAKGFPHYLLFPLVHMAFILDPAAKKALKRKEALAPVPFFIPQNEGIRALGMKERIGQAFSFGMPENPSLRRKLNEIRIRFKIKMASFMKYENKR